MFGRHTIFTVLTLCALASGCGGLRNDLAGPAETRPQSDAAGQRSITLAEALSVTAFDAASRPVSQGVRHRTLHVDMGRANRNGAQDWAGLAIRAPRASFDAMAFDVQTCWRAADAARPDPAAEPLQAYDPTDRLSSATARPSDESVIAQLAGRVELQGLKDCLSERGYAGVLLSEPPHVSNGPFNPSPNAPPPPAAQMTIAEPDPVSAPEPAAAEAPAAMATNDLDEADALLAEADAAAGTRPTPVAVLPGLAHAADEPEPVRVARREDPAPPVNAAPPRRRDDPAEPPRAAAPVAMVEPSEALEPVIASAPDADIAEAAAAPAPAAPSPTVASANGAPQRLDAPRVLAPLPNPEIRPRPRIVTAQTAPAAAPRPTVSPSPRPAPRAAVAPAAAPATPPAQSRRPGLPTLEELIRSEAAEPIEGREVIFVPLED